MMPQLPRLGDMLECAIWLDGTETPEMLQRWKERDCPLAMTGLGLDADVLIGPVEFAILLPGEDRVPPVPDHVHGPDVRLLVGEAKVIGIRERAKPSSFIADLEPRDLRRLRRHTRRAALASGRGILTDTECDAIINDMGPVAAGNAILAGAQVHQLPTLIFGRLTPEERRNGWSEAGLRAYLAERDEAHGLVGGMVPTAMRRPQPPVRIENTRNFSPHRWTR